MKNILLLAMVLILSSCATKAVEDFKVSQPVKSNSVKATNQKLQKVLFANGYSIKRNDSSFSTIETEPKEASRIGSLRHRLQARFFVEKNKIQGVLAHHCGTPSLKGGQSLGAALADDLNWSFEKCSYMEGIGNNIKKAVDVENDKFKQLLRSI
jgi:hypothetical protein